MTCLLLAQALEEFEPPVWLHPRVKGLPSQNSAIWVALA